MHANPSARIAGKIALVLLIAAAASVQGDPKPIGLDLQGMDRAVAPGDDFFRYANGTWLKTTEIPADRGAYGAGMMVFDRTNERTAALIQEAGRSSPARGTDAQRIADYYATFLDGAATDKKGLAPMKPTLDRIAAIADRAGLARFLGSTLRADVDVFNNTNLYTDNVFGLWVAQDLQEVTRYVPFLLQGG